MASRRFASVITFSAGTNTNSASLSTNFLISHGQATRSPVTFSRVIHFMLSLLWFSLRTSVIRKDENSAMGGRDHVEPVRRHQRGGVRAWAGRGSRAPAVARIDGFDKPGLADGDVDETRCRIEKRDIGRACDRPDLGDLARTAVHL